MKHLAVIFALSLSGPALAEDDGRDLLERGAQMLLEGLLKEMEPAIEDLQDLGEQIGPAMRGFVSEMGPALEKLFAEVKDWSVYHPPEILDNGDIIIRRKVDAPKPDGDDIEI